MTETIHKIELKLEGEDLYEVLSGAIDAIQSVLESGAEENTATLGGSVSGTLKLTTEQQCEHCGGRNGEHDPIPTDEDDGEGHIMRGAGTPQPCPALAE